MGHASLGNVWLPWGSWGVLLLASCGGAVRRGPDASTTLSAAGAESTSVGGGAGAPKASDVDVGGTKAIPETGVGGDLVRLDPAAGAPSTEPMVGATPSVTVESCSATKIESDGVGDSCLATYECDSRVTLSIECDGENDGTNTSLCSCRSGSKVADSGGLVDGESPASCRNALFACLRALGYSSRSP